jgi:hypothetical protein
LRKMRNSSLRSLFAAALGLFVAGLKAQTLDSVLSSQSTLSTFYSLIQVCYQLHIDLRIISDCIATAISRYYSTAAFERRNSMHSPQNNCFARNMI